jgi:hypothetical protein
MADRQWAAFQISARPKRSTVRDANEGQSHMTSPTKQLRDALEPFAKLEINATYLKYIRDVDVYRASEACAAYDASLKGGDANENSGRQVCREKPDNTSPGVTAGASAHQPTDYQVEAVAIAIWDRRNSAPEDEEMEDTYRACARAAIAVLRALDAEKSKDALRAERRAAFERAAEIAEGERVNGVDAHDAAYNAACNWIKKAILAEIEKDEGK